MGAGFEYAITLKLAVTDPYSTPSDALDLWCQSMTSEVPLGAKNSPGTFKCTLGKYCTHLRLINLKGM